MYKIIALTFLILSFSPRVNAASYTLPGDFGTGIFNGCSLTGSDYHCDSNISIPQNSDITLTSDVALYVHANFSIQSGFVGVNTNGNALNITVDGNVSINKQSTFTGNLEATGNVNIGGLATFTGYIVSSSVINIGQDSVFTGDITTTGSLNIGNATIVNGICTPTHPQCTGVVVTPTGCDTLADNFNSFSYSRQDGTVFWTSDWVESNDNGSPNNGDIRITGNRLLIENSGRAITRGADLSTYSSATLTFTYEESGFDTSSDFIDIEIQGGGSGWTSLQNFAGSSVGTGSANLSIASSFLASDFQIRLITSNSLGNSDRFYIDDLQIEACPGTSQPAIDFHFDEASWTGVSNEVIDSSVNSKHASISPASGLNTIANGAICRAGQFDGINDYIVSNDIFSVLKTTASMSFWIKTIQTGNDTNWLAPGVAGIEQSGGRDDIFWGWLDASGHIGISKWDTPSAKSSVAINDGVFHHIVLTRESASGAYKIYIDGVLNKSGTTGAGDVGTSFSSIGRIEDTAGTPEYLAADLDEIMVFNRVLTDAQVSEIYTNQAAGNNYDGSSRACLDTPLAEWRFDESSWSGTSGEVIDTQGNINATAVNGANTGGSNPAIAGNPGTCRYGVFDGSNDYIDLNGMPELTGSFTISAWIYANETGNDQRIFVDDQNNSNGFGFSLGDGGNGHLRFFSRGISPDIVDTQNAVISTGQWYHVAAVHNALAKTRQIFVNGAAVALTGGVTTATYTGTWGFDSGAASIGGENNSAGSEAVANWRFNGNIDEVRVYQSALTASQITLLMNQTRPCAATAVDHYVIAHSNLGVTCEAELITVTAHDASHGVINPASFTTITLTTSLANDGWTLASGSGTFTSPNQYSFSGSESSIQFWLSKKSVTTAPHMNIDVSDGTASDLDNGGAEDPGNIEFKDTGLRFYADSVNNSIATQIAGKASNINPNSQSLTLMAVETNSETGACETVVKGTTDILLSVGCINPSSCSRPLYLGSTSASTAITGNSPTYQKVTLDFGTTGEAAFVMNYPDSGKIQLHAQYTLPSSSLPSTGITLNGSSNQFVSRPFGFHIDAVSNPAGSTFDDTIYTTAGSLFTVNVAGSLWNSADDGNNDGIPDNHDDDNPANNANLGDNNVSLGGISYKGTPNFGQEGEQVVLQGILIDPFVSSYADADFPVQTLTGFTNGADSTASAAFNDVGIIELRALISDGDYLGTGTSETASMVSKSGYVGRFTPAAFSVNVTNNGVLDNTCSSAVAFTYIGQDFGYLVNPVLRVNALNTLSAITENYRGNYVKLNANSLTIDVSQDSSTTGTDANPLLVAYTPQPIAFVANNNGTVDFTLGDDQFRYGDSVTSNAYIKLANSEVPPFVANIDPLISQITDGEVTTTVSQSINLVGNTQRFGRIRMSNAYGSELTSLQMPMIVEFFNNTGYQLNTDDNCTLFNNADLFTIADNLVTPNASIISVTNPVAVAGVLGVTLTSPGADNVGTIDLSALLSGGVIDNRWLRYDWDADGNFDNDPSASATFGIYNGDARHIYIRQIYY